MYTKLCLSKEEVEKIVTACLMAASERNVEPTIAVVDEGGHLLYLARPPSQNPNSVEMATGKARTAAFRERPSSALEQRIKDRPGFVTYPNVIAVRGGVPVFFENKCVGGVGVSGVGNHDEPVAAAGAAAI